MSIISEALRSVRPDLTPDKRFPDADTRGIAPSQLAYLQDSTIQEVLTPEAVLAAGRWERDLEALDEVLPAGLVAPRRRDAAEEFSRRAGWLVAGLIGATLLGIGVAGFSTHDLVRAETRAATTPTPAAPVQVAAAGAAEAVPSQAEATRAYAELISRQTPPPLPAAAAAAQPVTAPPVTAPPAEEVAQAEVPASPAPAPYFARSYAALTPVRRGEAGSFAPQPAPGGFVDPQAVAPTEAGLADGLAVAHGGDIDDEPVAIESGSTGDEEVLFESAPVPAAGSRGKSSRKKSSSIETASVESSSDDSGVLRVEGIFWDKQRPMALIADKIVEVGARVRGYEVVSIEPGAVTLRDGNDTKILRP